MVIYSNKISELKKYYEFFDYKVVGTNKVIDAKFYNTSTENFRTYMMDNLDHIENKLDIVFNNDKDSRVLIVNFYPSDEDVKNPVRKLSERVFYITGIINTDGNPNFDALDALLKFIS